MSLTQKRLGEVWAAAIPADKIASVVEWAKAFVKLPGSALSESFDPTITPWTMEPLERTDDGTSKEDVVLPIQSGKSVIGEAGLCRQVAYGRAGDLQYNWQNDKSAKARWMKRVEPILRACAPVMARVSQSRFKWTKGLIAFPHCNLIMQGVKIDRNVASDSIRFQINEEVHDEEGGWKPGKLVKAHGRLTAFWNSFAGQISNASYEGDQLHKSFLAGTQQSWTDKCPGCGKHHVMRIEWDPKRPDLGGLRYEADKCRRGNFEYDYLKLASTVRFQMPCGYELRDDRVIRARMAPLGKYAEPRPGADLSHRSYIMEAASIPYIPFLDLIREKHAALKALKYGDPEPFSVYSRERESKFYKRGLQPVTRELILSAAKKDREGLPDREFRFGAGDYQEGEFSKGELPHFWHLIMDVKRLPTGKIRVLVVSEGKITTDTDLVDVFNRHEVRPSCVAVDSSYDAPHIYQLCLKHGYTAVKGENQGLYAGHKDKGRKVYSPPTPLHTMVNQPPVHEYVYHYGELLPHPMEPLFIRYSQFGLLGRVAWLRSSKMVELEIPGDVSEEFKSHLDSWQVEKRPNKKTLKLEDQWVQRRDRDDLLMCLCYVAMLMEDAGLIGQIVEDDTPSSGSEESTGSGHE